jgi:hypothetical protein
MSSKIVCFAKCAIFKLLSNSFFDIVICKWLVFKKDYVQKILQTRFRNIAVHISWINKGTDLLFNWF